MNTLLEVLFVALVMNDRDEDYYEDGGKCRRDAVVASTDLSDENEASAACVRK